MKNNAKIYRHVLLALAAMFSAAGAQAECVDEGWAYTCTGTSENADTLIDKQVYLDASAEPNTFTNVNNDPFHVLVEGYDYTETYWNDGFWDSYWDVALQDYVPYWIDGWWQTNHYFQQGEYGSVIKTEWINAITAFGENPVTVNNLGGKIQTEGSSDFSDPYGWDNHGFNFLRPGMPHYYGVVMAPQAAIIAGPEVSSLTVNNLTLNPDVFYAHLGDFGSQGVRGQISGGGDLTAGVYTNSPVLNVFNTGDINSVWSFAGASYTPPEVQDGTQYASVTSAGVTNITVGDGTHYAYIDQVLVVDREPLRLLAQQRAAAAGIDLEFGYSPDLVGPRNSVINVADHSGIGTLQLGSGAHVVNVATEYSGSGIGTIVVDQGDSAVVNFTRSRDPVTRKWSMASETLYKLHGERTFTLNSWNQYGHDITLNDVEGAVNTLNFFALGQSYASILANGLGTNTLNLNCAWSPDIFLPDTAKCDFANTVTGMTTINMTGQLSTVSGSFQATDAINLLGQHYFTGDLTVPTVTVGSGAILAALGNPDRWINQLMGDIHGNLVNNGTVYLGDATLDVTAYTDPATGDLVGGNAVMNPGSMLKVGIGPERAGYLNTAGTTSFVDGAVVTVNIKDGAFVLDGESHVIANNVSGTPTILNNLSFVQWGLSELNGDLLLTADVGISNALVPLVTPAAHSAANAFFASSVDEPQVRDLQATLQTFEGEEVIRAAERLHPEINDGAIRMVLGNTDKLFGILDSRLLDSYLSASRLAALGVEQEGLTTGNGLWVQGYGDRGIQDERRGVDGYDTSSVGMAMGIDRALDDVGDTRLGFAFGYARGNVTNSGNTVNNRIDVDSYLGTVYASHNYEQWYLNGAVGFGRHVYDTSRQLLQHSANGSHDSWQVAARVDAGFPLLFGDNLAFIPMASFDYSHVRESGYSERGRTSVLLPTDPDIPVDFRVPEFELVGSPINLHVDGRDVDSYRAGLGGKLIYTLQEPDWAAELELHAMLRHEFGDIAQDTTARFLVAGLGSDFKSPGLEPARDGIQLGGRVRLTGADENDQLTLLTSYDADIRDEYFGQTVTLNVRWDFDQATRYTRRANDRKIRAFTREAAAPVLPVSATEQDIAALSEAMRSDTANAPATNEELAVDLALGTWLNAQSSKNLDVYFNSYAASFVTPDGSSRQQWERTRRTELTRAANDAITVSYLTVKPDGDARAMAMFTLTTGNETVQKIVDLENRSGHWLIVREDTIALAE